MVRPVPLQVVEANVLVLPVPEERGAIQCTLVWPFRYLPDSAEADGIAAEMAEQIGKMAEHHISKSPNLMEPELLTIMIAARFFDWISRFQLIPTDYRAIRGQILVGVTLHRPEF